MIESLGFHDEMTRRNRLEPDDEVREGVVRLAVVDVRNGGSEASILHEGVNGRMGVDDVGCLLLPFRGVHNHVVQVTPEDLTHVLARPVVHIRGGARSATGFVAWYLCRLTLRRIRANGLDESLDGPTVVRREKEIQTLGWLDGRDLLADVVVDDPNELWEEHVGW